jgi:demethylmenaquinone methyltransferase/2-methoxy-6-polyprenyl-1,4-benzoquinol methylase
MNTKKTSGYYRDEFGRMARFYDSGLRFAFRMVGGETSFRKAVVIAADIQHGHTVIDVNCGTGTQALVTVAETGNRARVTGIDLSREMIAMAQRKVAGEPVDFIVANAEDMPFDDAVFDRAVITLAYHEMNRAGRGNALKEIRRVLKPGGLLVIADLRAPDTMFSRVVMRLLRIWETETLTDMWHRGIDRELADAGFEATGNLVTGRRLFEIVTARCLDEPA